MGFAFLFVLLIAGAWVVVIRLDKDRIGEHLAKRGDSVVSLHWRPFGYGWLSESSKEGGGNEIYEVEYRDVYGNLRHAWVKTAMFAGVFFAEDRLVSAATVEGRPLTADEKVAVLEEELRKLRATVQ